MSGSFARALSVACVALVLAVACDAQRTRLTLDVPTSARGRITSVHVAVHRAEVNGCMELTLWGGGTCGADCADVPPPPMGEPLFETQLTPGEDGRFGAPELEVPAGTRWRVVVVAELDEGDPLFGCGEGVAAGEDASVVLWWPWCSARACDRLYRPECRAQIQCTPGVLSDVLSPTCTVVADDVFVWEQAGRACGTRPVASTGPCRPARVRCEPGAFEPEVDGICPGDASTEPCVSDETTYMATLDASCDGAHPLCDARDCDPVSSPRQMCGAGACMGFAACVDGRYGECLFGELEACNGVDDDCDDAVDEGDAVIADCNAGRRREAPAADGCDATEGCVCGGGRSCVADGEACCDGGCVDLVSDAAHCGACGTPCDETRRCVLGQCVSIVVDGDAGRPVSDGGVAECRDPGNCNVTHRAADACLGGQCMCGAGDACALPSLCCPTGTEEPAQCVDTATSAEHCGGCNMPCANCVRGRCRTE